MTAPAEIWQIADGRTFEVKDPYYLGACNACGWVGSTETCTSDEDDDVYCPVCHHSGADSGKLSENAFLVAQSNDDHEITGDGKTVWVNDSDGMCLGRFTPRGVDVHGTTEQQLAGIQCEDCFPRNLATPDADWSRFVQSMKRVHGIDVDINFRPPK